MADILVIDDDPQMRQLITRILRGAGHTVREAEDGRGGIEAYSERPSALVISDIVMPDMDGIEVIRILRGEGAEIPIIAISGGSDPLYLRAATALGATASLKKPFSPEQLTLLVTTLLAGAEQS